MGTVTVRPDTDNAAANWTVTGAASITAALNDDSDSSYISVATTTSGNLIVGFAEAAGSIPSGAFVKYIMLRMRTKRVLADFSPGISGSLNSDDGSIAFSHYPTWSAFTTVSATYLAKAGSYDPDNVELQIGWNNLVQIAEAFADVVYVEVPVPTATAPSGTLTDRNKPAITWTSVLDGSGGIQTKYQVKLYDGATFGAFGSVDPDVTTPYINSGELSGSGLIWTPSAGLPEDDYRAYVRVAQTVNASTFWSDWDSTDFTIDVLLPGVPGIAATGDDSTARIEVEVTEIAGDADADYFEIETSIDGTTWSALRTLESGTDGLLTNPSPGSYVSHLTFDYEAGNSVTTYYRARAVHDYGADLIAASAWSSSASDSWASSLYWLKDPTAPARNTSVHVFSQPGFTQPPREGRFQGSGSSTAIVVSDYPSPPEGTMVVELDNADQEDELDALLSAPRPLLMQAPSSGHWRDRYLMLSNLNRRPIVDKLAVADSHNELSWIEVERPDAAVNAWPNYFDTLRSFGSLGILLALDATNGVTDLSGNGRNGTGVGSITIGGWTPGPLAVGDDGATDFDGTDDRITTTYGTRRNYMTNPRAVVDTSGWTAYAGTTLTRDSSGGPFNNMPCFKAVCVAGATTRGVNLNPDIENASTVAGKTWTASAWVKFEVGVTASLGLYGRNSAGSLKESASAVIVGTGAWERFSATRTLTHVDTVKVDVAISDGADDDGAHTFYYWGQLVELAGTLDTYFDGSGYIDDAGAWQDSEGIRCGWTGTAHASASDEGCYAVGTDRTFSCWFNRDEVTATQRLFGQDGTIGASAMMIYGTDGKLYMRLDTDDPSNTSLFSATEPDFLDRWVHAVSVIGADGSAAIYIDGELSASATLASTQWNQPMGNLRISGLGTGTTGSFDGKMQGVAVFERALTADEIATAYSYGLGA